jgi:hypothetical protein
MSEGGKVEAKRATRDQRCSVSIHRSPGLRSPPLVSPPVRHLPSVQAAASATTGPLSTAFSHPTPSHPHLASPHLTSSHPKLFLPPHPPPLSLRLLHSLHVKVKLGTPLLYLQHTSPLRRLQQHPTTHTANMARSALLYVVLAVVALSFAPQVLAFGAGESPAPLPR